MNSTRLGRPWLWSGALLIVALVGTALFLTRHTAVRRPTGPVLAVGGPAFDPIRADEIQTILPEDAIPAIVNPSYVAASEVTDFRGNEEVIGLSLNGETRAFAVATLSEHEIVNDVIGGRPVAVTW